MDAETKKRQAAESALEYVETGSVVGVGTGSTTAHFIDALARIRYRIDGTVASSEATAARLRERGLRGRGPERGGRGLRCTSTARTSARATASS